MDIKNNTVNVIDPMGKIGSLDENQAREALDHGYRVASEDEVKTAKNEQRFGGVQGAVMAGTLGAARAATLGLSDMAVTNIPGGFTPEQLQGLKDTNPVATTVGEFGGILKDPIGIGKMIGAAGKATTAGAETAVKAISKAEDISKTAKVLSSALGYGTEGAIFGGVANTINDQFMGSDNQAHAGDLALGDPATSGEKVLANVGWGALVGGSAGASLRLLGFGVTPALKKISNSVSAIRDELIGPGFGEESLVHKVMPKRFADAFADRQLNLDVQGQASVVRNVVSHLNDATENIQKEISDFGADVAGNKEAMSALFPKNNLGSEIGRKSLQNHLAEAEAMKHEAASKFVSENPDMAADVSGKEGFWQSKAGKKVLEMQSGAIDAIKQAPGIASEAQAKIAENLNAAVDNLSKMIPDGKTKEALDSLKNKVNFGKFVGGSSEDIFNHLKGVKGKISDFLKKEPMLEEALGPVNESINETLRDPKVFGAAGAASAIHDENISQLRKFISDTGKQTEFQKTFGEMKNGKWKFDIHKMHAVLADGDEITRSRNFGQLSDFFDHLKDLPENILNARKTIPNSTWRKQTIDTIIGNAKKTTEQAFDDYLENIKKRRPLYGWKDYAPILIAKWHPVLAAALEAYDFYQDPVHWTHELALIERMIGKTTKRSIDLLDSIFSTQLGAQKAIESKSIDPSKIKSERDEDEEHKKFKKIANDPDMVSQNIDKSTKELQDSAPNITQHLQVLGGQATSFLSSKIPQGNDHSNPLGKEYQPSRQEMTKFYNYKKLVEDPLLALQQVKDRTISPEAIEVLTTVYPRLYEELKGKMLEKAFDQKQKGKIIPFQTRQAMSIFLGQPLDQALSPQSILSNQMAIASAPKPNQPMPNGGKTRAKGLDKMDRSGRSGADYGAMSDKV